MVFTDAELDILLKCYAFILSWPDPDTKIADSEQPLAGVSESAESDAPADTEIISEK